MNCMMKRCVHPAPKGGKSGCDLLGECGCLYALERARELGGLEVHADNNTTIQALRAAGLVTVTRHDEWLATVKAVSAKVQAA